MDLRKNGKGDRFFSSAGGETAATDT
jgi:hypothetical protein